METNDVNKRKKKLEMDIAQLINKKKKETEILRVDKVYVSEGQVRTELKVTI